MAVSARSWKMCCGSTPVTSFTIWVQTVATPWPMQAALVRPGGIVVLSDHTTDPDDARAARHNAIELLRDRSHTSCLSPGAIVDLFVAVGLEQITLAEERFTLDFDEWFDRGTPAESKDQVRHRLFQSGTIRGFTPHVRDDGGITMECRRAIVRGVVPDEGRGS